MTGPVLVVGDLVTDVLAVLGGRLAVGSDTPAQIRITGGGSAANTAAWLAHAGVPVTLVAAAGADAAGDARLAELAAAGVRCAVRRCPDAATGTVVVLSDPDAGSDSGPGPRSGERSMLCDRGANLHLAPSDVDDALAATPGAVHLHLSGYTLLDPGSRPAGRHALAAAAERGLTTSVDAASAHPLRRASPEAFLDWVRGTDLLLANLDEALTLAGRQLPPLALARALTRHASAAVVKLGGAGAVWADRTGRLAEVPAEPAEVVDSTGAGDAFAAGLLGAWLDGRDPPDALRAGARLGARAVRLHGGRP